MALQRDATEEDFASDMALHPRRISEEQLHRWRGLFAADPALRAEFLSACTDHA
jgi:hypothetical protein